MLMALPLSLSGPFMSGSTNVQFCAGLQGQRRQSLDSGSGLVINSFWFSFASFCDEQSSGKTPDQEQPWFIIGAEKETRELHREETTHLYGQRFLEACEMEMDQR